MVVADGKGVPLAARADSASWAEVNLLERTLEQSHGTPRRVIADRAYDSDPLRERLMAQGVELICPYRRNNTRRTYEDGRKLRRFKKRWIVERTIAWLGNYRRVLIRWENKLSHYLAFVHVACLMITLRRL
jgi:transposase